MIRKQILWMAFLALSSGVFVSCIDEKYDLDNVDMTIGTKGDLTLPTSSTGEILLKNIMDLKEDGVVQVVDGEYYLVEDGIADVPGIDITSISIAKPLMSQIEAVVELDNAAISPARSQNRQKISVGGIELQDFTYTYTIQDEDKAYYSLGDNVSGQVPEEVVELKSVSFVDETTLDAKIQVYFDSEYDFINKVHLDNFNLSIPQGLHVSKAEFTHWTWVDGTELFEVEEAISIDNEKGVIVLTATDENTIIDKDHEVHVRVTFDKAVTGLGGLAFADNKVSLSGIFKLDGTFRIESKDFDLARLTQDQVMDIVKNQSFDVVCPNKIHFVGNADFAQDISVESFSGKVLSRVGDITPIALNDLPDFLNDPEVVLDLANPAFYMQVDNPMPYEATTSLRLSSVYEDGTPPVVKETGTFTIPAKMLTVFCIADHFEGIEIPENYQGKNVVFVPVQNLNELLKKLPENINVDVADIAMDIDAMPIPCQYDVKVDYQVYTPLEFGEEFKLVYQGTEEGLSEDLEDVNKLDAKEVRIEANAVTNFPMDLTLSVDALDRNNVSLKGKVVTVNDIVINAHKGSEETSKQPVAITIKPMSGHSIRELLEKLDKFHYRAVAEADSEGKLFEDAHIKLTDIKITLVGGVSYDAN